MKNQNVADGWTDIQRENSIPTHKHSCAGVGEGGGGGYKVLFQEINACLEIIEIIENTIANSTDIAAFPLNSDFPYR